MNGIVFFQVLRVAAGSRAPRGGETAGIFPIFNKEDKRVDELLLRRARDGNADAFEQLMTDLEPLVWRVCWHYLGDRENAADCGQDAMLKIWRSLSQYRGDCAFESWVYRIAASCCLDFIRKSRRDRSVSLEPLREEGFDPPDQSPGTEEQVLNKDRHARIRAALAQLPEEQRDALVWTQLEGRSYEETAAILQVSVGTLKSRVNRARLKMKEILSDEAELSPVPRVQRSERRARK